MKKRSWWKIVGLAGLAGVAATGVAVVRSERRRRAYTPDEVRTRLHRRLETVAAAAPVEGLRAGQRDPEHRFGRSVRRLFSLVCRG